MVGLLLALLLTQQDYSLFDEPELKVQPKTKVLQYQKPSSQWTFPGRTKNDLINHLLTSHYNNFKDIDLQSLDYQTLRDLHSLDHENRFVVYYAEPKVRKKKRVLFFTANWCPSCKTSFVQFAPWMRKSGWKINESESSHIQIVNFDKNQNLAKTYGVTTLPTFVVIDEEGKVLKKSGNIPKEQVPYLILE